MTIDNNKYLPYGIKTLMLDKDLEIVDEFAARKRFCHCERMYCTNGNDGKKIEFCLMI